MLFWVSSESDSALKKFLDETANMSADDRAKHLEKNQVRNIHTVEAAYVLLLAEFKRIEIWMHTCWKSISNYSSSNNTSTAFTTFLKNNKCNPK